MTRWVDLFEDFPEMLGIRREPEAVHLAYLRRHRNTVLIAGDLREAPGEAFVGGLWVLETESREKAVRLIEEDPCFQPGLRR